MNQYTTTDGKTLIGERALCAYLVKEQHEACHEADTVRLDSLCQCFGIIKSEVPPTPTPTEEELRIAAIPFEITMRQARLALRGAGLLDAVNTLVATLGGEDQDTWEYSSMVQRNHPLVGYVATQSGWTARQMDDLFTLAATK